MESLVVSPPDSPVMVSPPDSPLSYNSSNLSELSDIDQLPELPDAAQPLELSDTSQPPEPPQQQTSPVRDIFGFSTRLFRFGSFEDVMMSDALVQDVVDNVDNFSTNPSSQRYRIIEQRDDGTLRLNLAVDRYTMLTNDEARTAFDSYLRSFGEMLPLTTLDNLWRLCDKRMSKIDEARQGKNWRQSRLKCNRRADYAVFLAVASLAKMGDYTQDLPDVTEENLNNIPGLRELAHAIDILLEIMQRHVGHYNTWGHYGKSATGLCACIMVCVALGHIGCVAEARMIAEYAVKTTFSRVASQYVCLHAISSLLSHPPASCSPCDAIHPLIRLQIPTASSARGS